MTARRSRYEYPRMALSSPDALLTHLLTSDPTPPAPALPAWWSATAALRDRFAHPLERALALGLVAPTVGAAFLSGYRAALHALVPALGAHTRAALCASEDGGAHPRAIAARATVTEHSVTLDGTKRFVTGARDADTLLVLASEGPRADGRSQLALVRVAPDSAGVRFEDMPATPFVPDVAHASVTFTNAVFSPDARLPGDGWNDYVKPFRTVEDLHVQAAITAFLLGAIRRHKRDELFCERLVAHALGLRALADAAVDAPSTHIALAGSFVNLDAILGGLDAWWMTVEPAARTQWERDRRILTVARSAREQRRVRAWQTLGTKA